MKRGCGERVQGGLYLCSDSSPFGRPIEYFLVDPPVRWDGGQLRSPMIVEDVTGINHLIMGVGKTYYPFVPDFVEEARIMGVSKRIPINFDFSQLTPNKSKLLLVHPRAIPNFNYTLSAHKCPKHKKEPHKCIGDLWPLSGLHHVKEKHEVTFEQDHVTVKTPSVTYEVPLSIVKVEKNTLNKYSSGIFLKIHSFHFEYVNRQRKVPRELKKKIRKAGFKLEVLPE